jgi:UDP-N-acetyl-D-mannosaminuronate dehydrogenase
LIDEAMKAIAARPSRVVDRVRDVLSLNGRGLTGSSVLVLGVAYKPDVEDVRESPALEIIDGLLKAGAQVAYHDPLIPSLGLRDGSRLESVADAASYDADIVVVHTLHTTMDVAWLEGAPVILDTSYRLRDYPQRFGL